MNHHDKPGNSRLKPTSTFSSIQRRRQKPSVGQYRSRNDLSSNLSHFEKPPALKIEKSLFAPQRPMFEKSYLRSFHSTVMKAVQSNEHSLERPIKRHKPQPLVTNNLNILNSNRWHDPAVVYESYVEVVTSYRFGEVRGAKLVLSAEWDMATKSYKRDALVWSLMYHNIRLCMIHDHLIEDITFPPGTPLTLILGLKYDVALQIPEKGTYNTKEIALTFSENIFPTIKQYLSTYYQADNKALESSTMSNDQSPPKRKVSSSSQVSRDSAKSQKLTNRPDSSPIQTIPFGQRLSIPNEKKPSIQPRRDLNHTNNPHNIYSRETKSPNLRIDPRDITHKKVIKAKQVPDPAINFQQASTSKRFEKFSAPGKSKVLAFDSPFSFVFKDLKTLDITPDDFRKLDSGNFLNDTLINFFLKYFHQATVHPNKALADSIYLFNSFFYTKLLGGYNAVKKWTSKVDLFKYPFVFVPINLKAHWHLVLVYNLPVLLRDPIHRLSNEEALSDKLRAHSRTDDCVLFLLNSTGGSNEDNQEVVKNLKDYIVKEARDKLNVDVDRKRIVMKETHVPQQNNYCDCGVFLIHYVHMFMSDANKALNLMFSTSNVEDHIYNTIWKPHALAAKRENLKRRLVNFRIENKKFQASLPTVTSFDEGDVEAQEITVSGPNIRKPSVSEITHINVDEAKEDGLNGAIKKLDLSIQGSDDDLVDFEESAEPEFKAAKSTNSKKRKPSLGAEGDSNREMKFGSRVRADSVESVESVIDDNSTNYKTRAALKRSARFVTSASADADDREVVIVDETLD